MESIAPSSEPLRRWEWGVLALFALVVAAFGVLVEMRAVFQDSSKTDFGVYARAGWAVRTGQDPYQVIDNNGWHYCYPVPFALLMVPLADPYPWESREGYLPFAVSVGIWYLLGVIAIALTVHLLAKAVLPRETAGSRRWWYARMVPTLLCLTGLGYSLSRGQVNVLVILLIAAMFAASVRGQRFTSGLWLAAAAVVKLIPAYLVLYPLLRRDGRALLGTFAGAVLLLLVIPGCLFSFTETLRMHETFINAVLRPVTTRDGDQTRAKELTNTTATDSQSFEAVIHAWKHPDRDTRPEMASPGTKRTHLAIGAVLTLITIAVGARAARGTPADALIVLGCLCVLMLLLTPVSHMHYYALALPLVAGLWLRGMANNPHAIAPDRCTAYVLLAWSLLTSIPLLPGTLCETLREGGLATLATLALWAHALRVTSAKTQE